MANADEQPIMTGANASHTGSLRGRPLNLLMKNRSACRPMRRTLPSFLKSLTKPRRAVTEVPDQASGQEQAPLGADPTKAGGQSELNAQS
jgi:hypothetical protein